LIYIPSNREGSHHTLTVAYNKSRFPGNIIYLCSQNQNIMIKQYLIIFVSFILKIDGSKDTLIGSSTIAHKDGAKPMLTMIKFIREKGQ